MSRLMALTLTLAVLIGAGSVRTASGFGDYSSTRKTLAGLPGIFVMIEELTEDAEREGLRTTTLKTDVELRLRQAGIQVVDKMGASVQWLYANVYALKVDPVYVFSMRLELRQNVRLERNTSIRSVATTWAVWGPTGIIEAAELPRVREDVRDMVDKFINAYLAANPKTRGSPELPQSPGGSRLN